MLSRSLGEALSVALPELQRHAESMMLDTCIVDRKTGTTQSSTPPFGAIDTYSDPLYEGKCRVQRLGGAVGGGEPVTGEAEFGVQTVHFQLPLSAAGIKRGDRMRVTALGSSDPDLLGLTATVQANLTKTHPTKRTLVCEEVTS